MTRGEEFSLTFHPTAPHSLPGSLPADPSRAASTCCLPPSPSGLIVLHFTLLSLPALPLLSLLQSQFFILSLFPLLIARSLLFVKILSASCASLSAAIPLSRALLSPPHLCVLLAVPSLHRHFSLLPPPLAGSHPAPSTASSTVVQRSRRKDLWSLPSFSLSLPLSPTLPISLTLPWLHAAPPGKEQSYCFPPCFSWVCICMLMIDLL